MLAYGMQPRAQRRRGLVGLSLPRVALRRGRQRPRRARHEADLGVKAVAAPPAPRWTCYTKRTSVLVERGRGRRDGAHVRVHRSEELLRQRRMRRPRAGPADGEPRRGRSRPHGEDHLPGHHAVHEGARPVQPLPRVRDPRERGLRHGEAAHAALHGGVGDIYSIYLRYVSPEDIHPYSIDECFIDATPYLSLYRTSAREFAVMLMEAVLAETGVRATAGVGPNLFLAKVALDITAKHAEDCIGFLDQAEFERTIQTHRPSPISGTSARASRGAWRSTRCTTCAAYAR